MIDARGRNVLLLVKCLSFFGIFFIFGKGANEEEMEKGRIGINVSKV